MTAVVAGSKYNKFNNVHAIIVIKLYGIVLVEVFVIEVVGNNTPLLVPIAIINAPAEKIK